MNIRDAIAKLGMDLCRQADTYKANAREEALDALDGDMEARDRANRWRARSEAMMEATKKVDDLRVALERGDFG